MSFHTFLSGGDVGKPGFPTFLQELFGCERTMSFHTFLSGGGVGKPGFPTFLQTPEGRAFLGRRNPQARVK